MKTFYVREREPQTRARAKESSSIERVTLKGKT